MANEHTGGSIDLDALVRSLVKERESSPENPAAEVSLTAATATVEPEKESFSAPVEEKRPASTEAETAEPVEEDAVYEPPLLCVTEAAPSRREKKRREKKKRRKEPEVAVEDWADWGLMPIGHSGSSAHSGLLADIPESPSDEPRPVEPTEKEQPPEETVDAPVETAAPAAEPSAGETQEELAATRVIAEPVTEKGIQAPAEKIFSGTEELPDQLSLEELVRVETVDDDISGELSPEEQLRQTRQEKIRDFVLAGEEEMNEPEEEAEEPEEELPEIEDFTGYEDAQAVRLELQYRLRMAGLSFLLTGLLEIVLLVLTLLTVLIGRSPITAMGFLTVQAFMLVLMGVLNFGTVSRGFSGAAALRANGDTPAAIVLIFSLLTVIACFFAPRETLPASPALAGLVMLFSSASQWVRQRRIRENFDFVAYKGEKFAASYVEDPEALQELSRHSGVDASVKVAFFHPADFLSDFLANSEGEDGADAWARWMVPVSAGAALLLSLILRLTGSLADFWAWVEAFGFFLCLASVPTLWAMQVSLWRSCRGMLAKGGFLVGYPAVQAFGCPDGVTLNVTELYPDESMLLHGIKTFSGAHIDDAILDAASLAVRAGGPLSRVFCRIIENKLELLSPVDSLVYEQGMGLSGWVGGRRVLVGNRRLLENHGVDVPSSDYEARYAQNGRRLVYLSTAGELSAMFVVSYLPDEEIGRALQDLTRARVSLMLRSNDQNITAETLCRDFQLDEYYVEVLPASVSRMYERLSEKETEAAPAVLASNGHIVGMARALTACHSLRMRTRILSAVATALSFGGLFLGGWWATHGLSGYGLPALVYMLAAAALTCVAPLFKKG